MSADDDRLLDEYLSGDTELSRSYRRLSGDEQPLESIDAHIKAAARREVGTGPHRARAWRPAWTAPLAAAAVLVLAVGITLQLSREQDPMETAAPPDSGMIAKRDSVEESVPRDKAETEKPQTFSYKLPETNPAGDAEPRSAIQAEPLEQVETENADASTETLANLGMVLQSITPGRTTAEELVALSDWGHPDTESRVQNGNVEKWEYSEVARLQVPGVTVSLRNGVVQAVDVTLPPGTTLERLESSLALTDGQPTPVSSLPPAALAGLDPAGFSRAVIYENGSERYNLAPLVAFPKAFDGSSQVASIRFYPR